MGNTGICHRAEHNPVPQRCESATTSETWRWHRMYRLQITTVRPRLHWRPGQALLVLVFVCVIPLATLALVLARLINKARGRR